jgi:hypothetical protein
MASFHGGNQNRRCRPVADSRREQCDRGDLLLQEAEGCSKYFTIAPMAILFAHALSLDEIAHIRSSVR